MQPIEQHITTEQELAYKRYVERRRSHLACQITPETLAYMEEEFQTGLPCYQTRDPMTGQTLKPDPILAAIRDGQREVVLWLRREIALGLQAAEQNDEDA
ncbi:hypothetical protein QET40_04205 [Akkermansia sp. N21169]|uniref:hypothetical protein n=1 Tax=Akkermansia sp. N21169 TaxID=3040765 RepID=UPI00244EB206|nr:hypothetical protein [Akkermansia sp. N21169]MDH3068310.1 hypothetical protein [Akkermansia sp. N21169]